MPNLIYFFPLVLYALLALWVVWVIRGLKSRKEDRPKAKQQLSDLTLLVPFRNEEQRIGPLLESLKFIPPEVQLIFVDDHSQDRTSELIASSLTRTYSLLSNELHGKKEAIRLGVNKASTPYILTMDADVEFGENYFAKLQEMRWKTINILPVQVKKGSFKLGFFAWEYQLQQRVFTTIGETFVPLTASGANLLFKKDFFEKSDPERTDYETLSGDDHFLLREAVNAGMEVSYLYDDEVVVQTANAAHIAEALKQRLRWVNKTHIREDFVAFVFGFALLGLQMWTYASLLLLLLMGHPLYALGVLVVKMDLDGHIASFKYMKPFHTWEVALYEVFYPIYVLVLFVLSPVLPVKWKGRDIKKAPNGAFK